MATIVIDGEHCVTHWNRACEVATGVRAKDMIGTNRQWQPFYASARPIMADLVRRADDGIYRAKRRGRNAVVTVSPGG